MTEIKKQWFPEPWEHIHVFAGEEIIRRACDDPSPTIIAHCEHEGSAARIAACVNACAWMDDPEAEIDTLRVEYQRAQATLVLMEHLLGRAADALRPFAKLSVGHDLCIRASGEAHDAQPSMEDFRLAADVLALVQP